MGKYLEGIEAHKKYEDSVIKKEKAKPVPLTEKEKAFKEYYDTHPAPTHMFKVWYIRVCNKNGIKGKFEETIAMSAQMGRQQIEKEQKMRIDNEKPIE